MRGDLVIVRDARGKPLVRRLWEVTPTIAYICNEDRYQRLLKDYESDLPPIGFPIENVYSYDPAIEKTLLETYQRDTSVWDRLKPLSESLARR